MRFDPQLIKKSPDSPDIESKEVVLGPRKRDNIKEF
jgi:hypothetical protein